MTANKNDAMFRSEVFPGDISGVRNLVGATGVFSREETNMAVDLVKDKLLNDGTSDYHFLFADEGPDLAGYICFGPIECTVGSFDLYWIAVAPSSQRSGTGRALLNASLKKMQSLGAQRIFVETSSTPLYEAARELYRSCGFSLLGTTKDFYRTGDDRLIFGIILD